MKKSFTTPNFRENDRMERQRMVFTTPNFGENERTKRMFTTW